MRLGVYFLFDGLVEGNDGVSYCASKCKREMKKRSERLTMDKKIDTSFDGRDLGWSEHDSGGHLRLLPLVLFRQWCGSVTVMSSDRDI